MENESGAKRFHWAVMSAIGVPVPDVIGAVRGMWEVRCDHCALRQRFSDSNWQAAQDLADSHRGWLEVAS